MSEPFFVAFLRNWPIASCILKIPFSIKTKTVSCNTRRLYVITVEDLPDKKCTFKRSNKVFEVQNNGFTQIFCPVSLPHGQI